jgi:hypothetical protein
LDLAFLVDAQDQGFIRRIEIQTDDIADFFDEERVGGEFERAPSVGLDAEQGEITLDGAFRQFRFARERAKLSSVSRSRALS